MPRMIVRRNDGVERRVVFDSDLRIGRDEQNDLVLEDPERGVSRFHAEIRRGGPDWAVIDLGSRNGTIVNGSAIQGLTPLPPGTLVTIGPFSLELVDDTDRSFATDADAPAFTIFSPVTPAGPTEDPPLPVAPAPKPSVLPSRSANEKRAWLFIATAVVVLIIIEVFL